MFTVSGLVTVIVQMLKGVAGDSKPLTLLLVACVGIIMTVLFRMSDGSIVDANIATLILEGLHEGLAASGIYAWYSSIESKNKKIEEVDKNEPLSMDLIDDEGYTEQEYWDDEMYHIPGARFPGSTALSEAQAYNPEKYVK